MVNPPVYEQAALLQLLGQCTYELAVLRGQVVELQAKLAEQQQSANGKASEEGLTDRLRAGALI